MNGYGALRGGANYLLWLCVYERYYTNILYIVSFLHVGACATRQRFISIDLVLSWLKF